MGYDPTGHKPWTALGIALEAQIEVWRSLVQTYLESAGYDVRRGGYALPDSYRPLDAVFECVRWKQEGHTVTVVPVG